MRLHKTLTDDKLEVAFLITSIFPHKEIEGLLDSESISIDRGDFEWWQVAQLLRIEMTLRGIVDNTDLQDRYIKSRRGLK